MGIVISIIIVLFVIGSVTALRPSPFALHQDKFRLLAKKLEFLPTLVACPDWIRGTGNELGKGMIGKYTLVLEGAKLPNVGYQILDNEGVQQWRPLAINGQEQPTNFSLDRCALDLPKGMQPFIKGLETKANNICIYWYDNSYIHPQHNRLYRADTVESELLALKDKLIEWADLIQKS